MGCFPCLGGSNKQSKKKINSSNNQNNDQAAAGLSFLLEVCVFFPKKIMNCA